MRRLAHAALPALPALPLLTPVPLVAQEVVLSPRAQWEVRADARVGAPSAIQLGAGANVPAGAYVRLGAAVAIGPAWREGRSVTSARVDAVARYLLDPFREIRWAPYGGAGFTAGADGSDPWRAYVLVLVGLEGPVRNGWRTALELSLGGGTRAAIVMRRARVNGR